jgi:hypothetical protein
MKKLIVFWTLCVALLFLCGSPLVPMAAADPGDIDGDGRAWTLSDLAYLIRYLFSDGMPPPNPIDADVDGFPGINAGDVYHFAAYFVDGRCWPVPYDGVGVRQSGQVRFVADPIFSTDSGILDTTQVKIIGGGWYGLNIPLSFANQPDQVEVVLDSVSFVGGTMQDGGAKIDNINKTVLIYGEVNVPETVSLLATLYFTKISDGDPLLLSITDIPPSHSVMLVTPGCAGSPESPAIFNPKFTLAANGDLNCDGLVDLADIVYNINYLYKGGPPPCGW